MGETTSGDRGAGHLLPPGDGADLSALAPSWLCGLAEPQASALRGEAGPRCRLLG